jgi:hypothetical protein
VSTIWGSLVKLRTPIKTKPPAASPTMPKRTMRKGSRYITRIADDILLDLILKRGVGLFYVCRNRLSMAYINETTEEVGNGDIDVCTGKIRILID